MARPTLIVGNWKMNGLRASADELARKIVVGAAGLPGAAPELVLCPPSTLLDVVKAALGG